MKTIRKMSAIGLLLFLTSCLSWFLENPTFSLKEIEVKRFSLQDIDHSTSGRRIKDNQIPTGVLVSIRDESGKMVAEQKKLELHKFGESYLSVPLTLTANGADRFYLTEFFVIGSDLAVQYTTPR